MTHGKIETGKRAPTNITGRLRTGMRELAYNVDSAFNGHGHGDEELRAFLVTAGALPDA
jgi:hypothetical protein